MRVLCRDGSLRRHTDADELVTFSILAFASLEPKPISRSGWVRGLGEFALQCRKSRSAFHQRSVRSVLACQRRTSACFSCSHRELIFPFTRQPLRSYLALVFSK